MMLRDKPLIYNIPSGGCFAEVLAQGLLERTKDDPFSLSEYLLLLPSRRSARILREAFLRLSGGEALLLPRMQPVGDVDADDVSIFLAGESAEDVTDFPPAIPPLERQLLLARLILQTGTVQSFDQAASLARDLGRFLDEVQGERISFDGLSQLAPEEFAGHWQKTLEFLKILTQAWPAILQERGVIDTALRRNLLLQAQIDIWTKNPPSHPVIAAGATGTIPAVRDLLHLVARLPQGEVVLPGLDAHVDDVSWDKMEEDHPQHNIKTLLLALEADRADVTLWPVENSATVNKARGRMMSEAMRPAATTDKWRQLTPRDIPFTALDGLMRIDCTTPREEAEVIAFAMREALETPKKTAALITPDRRLARRVAIALRRWGIRIDDSGGQPVTDLPAGAFLLLTAEAAEEKLAPVTLLSLLKHPVMAAGMAAEELRGMVYLLDQVVLRGPRPAPGLTGLRQAIGGLSEKRAGDKLRLEGWLDLVEARTVEFLSLMARHEKHSFRDMMQAHIRMAEALAATEETTGAARLWKGEAGDAASDLMQDLLAAADSVPPLEPAHYVSLLRMMLKSVTVRPRYGTHPRLSILGQIEARMYCADLVILGGLNEGTWPELPPHDPWMSRPMRKKFGLPAPEKLLGLAAHDFVQAATASEVILTRAEKVEGTPTVPARWLLRLEAVLHAIGMDMPTSAAGRYRQWAADMDKPAAIQAISRPAPTPPVEARPNKLSVTKIETWMRDPYQIYAQHVLNLRSLDPLDADPGGAERGTFIHAALEAFTQRYPETLPEDADIELLKMGRAALKEMRIPPEVEAFWWPRFERIAPIFVAQEREWRGHATPLATEISGTLDLGGFTLTGKADRIDSLKSGGYAIIDYKSGFVPKKPDIQQGLSPQLPLEALMLGQGAFEKLPAGKAEALVYWRVTGSGQKPVEQMEVSSKDVSVAQMTAEAEAGLRDLIAKFADEKTPYYSQPRADAKPRFSDYNHLARLKEWGVSGDEAEEEAA
jgi:ATP-dependent helicase/nuclease subunit B